MIREDVAEIIMYCKEHKVTYKSRQAELNIPVWRFYESKSLYQMGQHDEISRGRTLALG